MNHRIGELLNSEAVEQFKAAMSNGKGDETNGVRTTQRGPFTDEAHDAFVRDRLATPAEIINLHNDRETRITLARYLSLVDEVLRGRNSERDGGREICIGCEREFQPVKFSGQEGVYGNFVLVESGVDGSFPSAEPVCYFCKTGKTESRLSPEQRKELRRLPSYCRDDTNAIIEKERWEVEKTTRNISHLLQRARR